MPVVRSHRAKEVRVNRRSVLRQVDSVLPADWRRPARPVQSIPRDACTWEPGRTL